jgi:hypothetical protein
MIFGDDEVKERKKELRRRIMKASRKQEDRSAKTYKGSRNAGSGSGWLRKNDVRSHKFLIENKLTNNAKSYSVKLQELNELTQRAVLEDRTAVLQFDIGGKHFVVLNEADFITMAEDLGGLDD